MARAGVASGEFRRISPPGRRAARPFAVALSYAMSREVFMPWSWFLVAWGAFGVYLGGLVYLGWLMRRDDG